MKHLNKNITTLARKHILRLGLTPATWSYFCEEENVDVGIARNGCVSKVSKMDQNVLCAKDTVSNIGNKCLKLAEVVRTCI